MNKRKISAFLIIALVLTNNSFATFAQYLNRIDPFEKVSVAEKSISNFQPHNSRTDAKEIPIAYDITEGTDASWEGWYKNFIVDLNAVRFRFFDGNGVKVREEICLPSQFSGSSFSFENIYIKGIKDIILQDTIPYSISLVGFKFSDNIPYFRLLENNDESILDENSQDYTITRILKTDFTKISNPKLFNEWIDEENGINLDKLDKEVGFNLLDKEGKNISVSDWLKSGEDGKLNSITIEPIAFFPGSTEEIYESNKKCSEEYNMNFDNAFQRTLTNLKAAGEELELARINYKGSGNWFDNLVKGVTDAIDKALETVESMGRWLDDNLLDGRINAMYTFLDQIGGSGSIEKEYIFI